MYPKLQLQLTHDHEHVIAFYSNHDHAWFTRQNHGTRTPLLRTPHKVEVSNLFLIFFLLIFIWENILSTLAVATGIVKIAWTNFFNKGNVSEPPERFVLNMASQNFSIFKKTFFTKKKLKTLKIYLLKN